MGTVFFLLIAMIIFRCNWLIKNDFNCMILRHGSYKGTMLNINPHLNKEECDRLFQNNEIYGFQFHPEVNSKMIKDWYSNLKSLNMGTDSLSKILKEHKVYHKKNYFWLNKILNRII